MYINSQVKPLIIYLIKYYWSKKFDKNKSTVSFTILAPGSHLRIDERARTQAAVAAGAICNNHSAHVQGHL